MAALHVLRVACGQLLGLGSLQVTARLASTAVTTSKDAAALIPANTAADVAVTIGGGQAFANDLRGTSGLGLGDGIKSHTAKWLSVRAHRAAWASGC
jgi:hypothetical protein